LVERVIICQNLHDRVLGRDAGSRTYIVEFELRPSLHWMRNRDGSVNFHDPAVVHALAMATRLLVADRLLAVAWLALHRV
jgi:hypothetical protein